MAAMKVTTTAAAAAPSKRDRIEAQIAALQAQLDALPEAEPEPGGKSAPRRVRFTFAAVEALKPPATGEVVWWDSPDARGRKVAGFCVRVSATGAKSFMLQARTKAGKPFKMVLGRHPSMPCEEARELARQAASVVAAGGDPAADRAAAREAEEARRAAETFNDLWATFETEHIERRLRPASRSAYTTWWSTALAPRIGKLKVRDISRQQIERLHGQIVQAHGAPTANRCHAVLSSMLSLALKQGWREAPNPAAGIRLAKETARDRMLTDAELRRLVAALAASDRLEARALEFMLATGCRKSEALTSRWQDFRDGWWTVPPERSKSKRAVKRPLNGFALSVLAKLRTGNGGPFVGSTVHRLADYWRGLVRDLDLGDLHVHDLRHVAASLAVNAGVSLAGVGSLLGHGVNSASITARYSHFADAGLAAAAGAVGDRLAELSRVEPAGSA